VKSLALTINGTHFEMKLDDAFADFVSRDLQEAGMSLAADNKPKALLKAYLRLAKQAKAYEKEIELLVDTFDAFDECKEC
jgi:hypothetical protein